MSDARAPEPRPVTILILGIVGAMGAVADGAGWGFAMGRPYSGAQAWAASGIGFGWGAGIGVALCVFRDWLFRVFAGVVSGMLGVEVGWQIGVVLQSDDSWKVQDEGLVALAAIWGAMAGAALVAAHDLALRVRPRIFWRGIIYAGAAGVSALMFLYCRGSFRQVPVDPGPWGICLAAAQWAGLEAARWADRGSGREAGAAAEAGGERPKSRTLTLMGLAQIVLSAACVPIALLRSSELFGGGATSRAVGAAAWLAAAVAGVTAGAGLIGRKRFARVATVIAAALWLSQAGWILAFASRGMAWAASFAAYAFFFWPLCLLIVFNRANRWEFEGAERGAVSTDSRRAGGRFES